MSEKANDEKHPKESTAVLVIAVVIIVGIVLFFLYLALSG